MNATGIEYLDVTWSPLVGCSGIGCAVSDHCWAKYMKRRNLNGCPLCTVFKPHAHFERLDQPYMAKTKKIIGACYSADFWDNGFTTEQRDKVLVHASLASWHWFINLTKQTQNIPRGYTFPKNWIQGASICTEADLYRVPDLWKSRAEHLMLSIEPLYQRLEKLVLDDIDWVIIGGQTHPLKFPHKDLVDEIISKAKAQDIPVFIKNNLDSIFLNRNEILKEYPEVLQLAKTEKTI